MQSFEHSNLLFAGFIVFFAAIFFGCDTILERSHKNPCRKLSFFSRALVVPKGYLREVYNG